ncbi:MAG: hypothetical protein RLZZ76_72 [Candidatus Parcubacteria bacterium]|jgi:hypothetical protein
MKQFSSQFKKQSESIRMRASERSELKAKLVSYMEYHPLPKEMREEVLSPKATKGSITSEPFFIFNINTTYLRNFSGAFALFCLFVVPMLAENSLPGDVLYPMKVQFNEEVRSSLSFTPYAKVAWETERLERRISEARLLVAEGKMTPEIQTQFTEAIKTHADSAQRELAILKESDADKALIAEIAFASALEVQSEVLGGESNVDASPEEETAILAVASVVEEARSSVAMAQGVLPVSYENVLAAVESESTQVYELFSSVEGDASLEEVADVERRLEDIKRKIASARTLHDGGVLTLDAEVASVALSMSADADTLAFAADDSLTMTKIAADVSATATTQDDSLLTTTLLATETPEPLVVSETAKNEATMILKDALTDIQKLINYLTNIEVRQSVSLETLVPVTPTAGERALEIKKVFEDTKRISAEIKARELNSRLRAKVRHGQNEIDKNLSFVSSAMSEGNLDGAEVVVRDAHALAVDIEKLVLELPIAATTTAPIENVEVVPVGDVVPQ